VEDLTRSTISGLLSAPPLTPKAAGELQGRQAVHWITSIRSTELVPDTLRRSWCGSLGDQKELPLTTCFFFSGGAALFLLLFVAIHPTQMVMARMSGMLI
jgi:hypothetical protein